jgi:hypothetical protein
MAPVEPVEAEHIHPMPAEKLYRTVPPHELPAFPFDAVVAGIVEITERHYFERPGKDRDNRNHEKAE